MTVVTLLRNVVFALLAGISLHVEALESYFSAEIPVSSQTRKERSAAAQQALLGVLVRVSGTEAIKDNRFIVASKVKALSIVELYQYMELDDPIQLEQGYVATLRLQFSERLVKQMLRDAGACFWSVNRPKTLVWLVEDSLDYGKQLLAHGEDNPIFSVIEKEAAYRGVPLVFPLGDFEDQVNLGAERVWALDETAIRAASLRYQADTILVGKLTKTSLGETWSNWMYLYPNSSRLHDLRSADLAEIGPGVITPLANYLSQQFAVCVTEKDSGAYYLEISGIQSFAAYRGFVEAFEEIEAVNSVFVGKVDKGVLSVRIASDASIDQLRRLINLSRSLQPDSEANNDIETPWGTPTPGSRQNPLRYRWQR